MFILRKGAPDSVERNLESLWAEYQAELASVRLAQIADGLTVKIDGEEIALRPFPAYVPSDDRAGIKVILKGLDPSSLSDYELAMRYYDDERGDLLDEQKAKATKRAEAMRVFVEASYETVGPLAYEGEEPLAFTGQVAEDFGLLNMLALVAHWLAGLPIAKKKHCGLPRRSISPCPSSIAAGAPIDIKRA